MPFEPVKQRVAADAAVVPGATPLPIPADSSFWTLPAEEQQRLMSDLETYRRELPRLLEAGNAGKYALVRDGQVLSIWDTLDDATQAAGERFGSAPVAIYAIRPQDLQIPAPLEVRQATSCQS
ncbi:MAG: hypothetical protein JNM56_00860 [Planctomycetia bacterium]|nr:hypothetical protein [Planctomycetia bacterium]